MNSWSAKKAEEMFYLFILKMYQLCDLLKWDHRRLELYQNLPLSQHRRFGSILQFAYYIAKRENACISESSSGSHMPKLSGSFMRKQTEPMPQ